MQEATGTNIAETASPGAAAEGGIVFDLGVCVEEGIMTDAPPHWWRPELRGRGVGLAGDRIRWRVGNRDNEARLGDIASIHLLYKARCFICRIRFKQGLRLSIFGPQLFRSEAEAYRDFVRRLHARLGPTERASIQFIRGVSETAYAIGQTLAIFGKMVVALTLLMTVVTGGGGTSGAHRLLLGQPFRRNEPGTYDPAALPYLLLPDAAPAPHGAVQQPRGPSAGAGDEISYDLYVQGASGVLDHGVWLGPDRIGWGIGGDTATPFTDIAQIHLVARPGLPYPARRCTIRFRGGAELAVLDGNPLGIPSAERAALWRDFLSQLHARIGHAERVTIRFERGYAGSSRRYRAMRALTVAAGALIASGIAVVPLLGGLGAVLLVSLLGAAGLLWWIVYGSLRLNAPGSYDPTAVAKELLGGDASGWRPAEYGPVLGLAAAGFLFVVIWTAGIHETARMFEAGEVQRALEVIDRRSHPNSVFVHTVEITARRLTVTAVDPVEQRWQSWRVSHAAVYGGWQEWDRVSGPEPSGSGVIEHSFVWLTSDNVRLIAGIVQKALADAALDPTEATINMEYDIGGENDWDAASRRWVERPRQWVIKVSDARGTGRRSVVTDPTSPIPVR